MSSTTMRAAVVQEPGEPLAIEERERPEPESHGIVLEIEACGICRSDWHGWMGHVGPVEGTVLGHEPAGTVIAVGEEVERVDIDDRVAVAMNLADGTCPRCLHGKSNLCENQRVPGFHPETQGAWAEEFAVPWADVNAVHLPDGVSTAEMAGLGCRFMTAFHGLAHRADIEAGDWVAVHGCGGVGLSAVHIASALGATVVAVDLHDDTLEMAADLGADATVNASSTEDVRGEIQIITDGGADVSVDALGIAETCQNSIDSLGLAGQHIQIGVPGDESDAVELPVSAMLGQELDLLGSVGMPPTRYDEILHMLEHGKVHPEKLITREVSLEDVNDRLEAMTNYETRRIEVITEF